MLDSPGDSAHFWQPQLLRQIPVPAGAGGGPWSLPCSLDGLLFLTAGAVPCVHVLDLAGRFVCHLPCHVPGIGDFVPEDVAVTAAGLMVVSDLVRGAVHTLQHKAQAPRGRWMTVDTFLAPRGLAVYPWPLPGDGLCAGGCTQLYIELYLGTTGLGLHAGSRGPLLGGSGAQRGVCCE